MNSWRSLWHKLSQAMEFANIDSVRELETLLAQRHGKPVAPRRARRAAAPARPAVARRMPPKLTLIVR